jgi:hypothetical protein
MAFGHHLRLNGYVVPSGWLVDQFSGEVKRTRVLSRDEAARRWEEGVMPELINAVRRFNLCVEAPRETSVWDVLRLQRDDGGSRSQPPAQERPKTPRPRRRKKKSSES